MNTEHNVLLATDLDRTILPDGPDPESEGAMAAFAAYVAQPHVTLAYLSGRSLEHALDGIQEYGAPLPEIFVGDTGTSMYLREGNTFAPHNEWRESIAPDWCGLTGSDIHTAIKEIKDLTEQESLHQGEFKQSYFFPEEHEDALTMEVEAALQSLQINAVVVTLIDHVLHRGYLDILPATATKEHALKYLQQYTKTDAARTVYAGDGGNDLDPITCGYKAVVVRNATDVFKKKVVEQAEQQGTLAQVYFAEGGYKGMNGNYSAGVLEGLDKFGIL